MNTLEGFFTEAREYLSLFDVWAEPFPALARVDHLGYKCGSKEEFEACRALLEPELDFLYQSYISGRRIAFCKFKPALKTVLGDIAFLELSDQKPDGSQVSGFDHLEIYPLVGTMEAFASHCAQVGFPFTPSLRPHHATYDRPLTPRFTVRIEPEPLLQKIMRDEMVVKS